MEQRKKWNRKKQEFVDEFYCKIHNVISDNPVCDYCDAYAEFLMENNDKN